MCLTLQFHNMDRSRTPPPRTGLHSQPRQLGPPPFPPVPPPPPGGPPLPFLAPPHRPLQHGHWPTAPAHRTVMTPPWGPCQGLSKLSFPALPSHNIREHPGARQKPPRGNPPPLTLSQRVQPREACTAHVRSVLKLSVAALSQRVQSCVACAATVLPPWAIPCCFIALPPFDVAISLMFLVARTETFRLEAARLAGVCVCKRLYMATAVHLFFFLQGDRS